MSLGQLSIFGEENDVGVKMSRVWAMPSADTFSVLPIAQLLHRYLDGKKNVVDPFARNSRFAHLTNDLNPKTSARYHLHAKEFSEKICPTHGPFDGVIFDPPYSNTQIKRSYESVGIAVTMQDTQNGALYADVRNALSPLVATGGIAISFGWNSAGFGVPRGFILEEILLVCHGGAHNDTICVVERKRNQIGSRFCTTVHK